MGEKPPIHQRELSHASRQHKLSGSTRLLLEDEIQANVLPEIDFWRRTGKIQNTQK